MSLDYWAIDYRRRGRTRIFVKVFDSGIAARDWYNAPPAGITPVGVPWSLNA